MSDEKFLPNTIVIVDTVDMVLGRVVAPAIVRYYDEDHDAYEVNVLVPSGKRGSLPDHLKWWTVTANEISEAVKVGYVQNPPTIKPGRRDYTYHTFGGDK